MFARIATIALLAFFAKSGEGEVWNGFVATWDRNTSTHFYKLPKTLVAAEAEGWTCISGVNPPEGVTPMCYKGDPTLVLLFSRGKAMGFQIAFLVSEIENSEQPLKYDELDVIIAKTINGERYYTATAYFYNDGPEGIRRIWLQEKNRSREIPTKASLVLSNTEWLKKNCIPTMGTHFYTWDFDSDCATLNPWFFVAIEDDVVGLGFQGIGDLTSLTYQEWWETLPDGALSTVMSDPPYCAVDAVAEYGKISMHVWFVEKPQNIKCS